MFSAPASVDRMPSRADRRSSRTIRRKKAATGTTVTFTLDDTLAGPVSVVGDFNDWTPGSHVLRKRSNGTRSVAVTLPAGEVRFRYLADGGVWFDDPQADAHDQDGSLPIV